MYYSFSNETVLEYKKSIQICYFPLDSILIRLLLKPKLITWRLNFALSHRGRIVPSNFIVGEVHRETFRDPQLEFIVSTEEMVCLFRFLVYGKKSFNLYAKKFDGLLVNNNSIVN